MWRVLVSSRIPALLGLGAAVLAGYWLTRPPGSAVAPEPAVFIDLKSASAASAVATVAVAAPLGIAPVLSAPKAAPSAGICKSEVAGETQLRLGDQLKISVYERSDIDESRVLTERERTRTGLKSYRLRQEVSGEFRVEEDGSLNLPLLGALPAAGHSVRDIEADIAKMFTARVGHVGFINVIVAERQPIYVLGPVKTPGAYKFTPGMTVLHGVALAGGFERLLGPNVQPLDAFRESERHTRSGESLKRLLAQQAVLQAERSGSQVVVPARLREIADAGGVRTLIDNERKVRSIAIATRRMQLDTLAVSVRNLKSAVQSVENRLKFLASFVATRAQREKVMSGLHRKGLTNNNSLAVVQMELSDGQQREQEARAELAQVQIKLNEAVQQQQQIALTGQLELEKELNAATAQIAQEQETFQITRIAARAGDELMDPSASPEQRGVRYEVIRRTLDGASTFNAPDTCDLQPGDLIRVHLPGRAGMTQ